MFIRFDSRPINVTIDRKLTNQPQLVVTTQAVPNVMVVNCPVFLGIRILDQHSYRNADLRTRVEHLSTLTPPIRGILVPLQIKDIDTIELLDE